MTRAQLEDELIDEIASFDRDPLGYVHFAFPWGEGELEDAKGPREWQAEALDHIGKKLRDPKTRFQPIRIAVASGHGIGKTGFISMVICWGMSTCEDCKVITTANTDTQLRTKTWPEVSKWFRLAINSHWFKTTATAVHSVDKKHEKTWRADAIPWSVNNTEAFAGLHNKKKRIVVIFDEGSAIDDKVWDVAEGALTDEDTEIIFLALGNPTRNTGKFKECFGRMMHRWKTFQIDSREVEGTNKTQLEQWVKDYGEDSDFVKVRVRGMFPSASLKQFISVADVDAAFDRTIRLNSQDGLPKILTVDPSWEGDDEFVIGLRQGLIFKILATFEKNDDDVQMANIIAKLEDDHKADAVFVDGGYGTGIVSVGKALQRKWMLVWFGEKSADPGCLNKRAEMWKSTRDWLKSGGSIPNDKVLYQDLIGPETVSRMDGKIQLESKKDMKARGLKSPGRADALALSFAYPVSIKSTITRHQASKIKREYDPYEKDRL